MGELVKMTDHPRGRWAVIDISRERLLSRNMGFREAEQHFCNMAINSNSDIRLVQEVDIDIAAFEQGAFTKVGGV